jgi:[ribosomal protein S5]-alanine N-acetyltransferase
MKLLAMTFQTACPHGNENGMNNPNITIEPISLDHADDVQHLVTDPAIAEMTRIPHPYPPDGAKSFIEKSIEGRAKGTDFVFAIKGNGILAGVCGLHCHDESKRSFELGYWIGKPFWGRGIATKGVALVLEYGIVTLHLQNIYAECLERNIASQHVLENNGFCEISRRQNTDPKWRPEDRIIRYDVVRR